MKNEFLLGFNYWASHAGIYMWRRYDKQVVERDLKLLASHGANAIRVFPLWEDFQPLTEVRFISERAAQVSPFKMRVGDKPLVYHKFPDSGLDEGCVESFKHMLTVARKNGLKVVVSFITGWMSGRTLVPAPFINRDLVRDPEVILYECAFIRDLISEIKDFDNVVAYEPGNETNCLNFDVSEYEAELWLRTITNTIRLADPTIPVYAGMHGTSAKGAWSLNTQSKIFDMMTPHPYPAFTQYCDNERLTAMRASMHAAAEGSYYASIARKPSMVQEIGVLGHNYLTDGKVPEYVNASLMTSYMTGSRGFLWWCAFDQDHLDFAPYDYQGVEINLGMCYSDGTPKPALLEMKRLQTALNEIGELPTPQTDAVCVLSGATGHWERAYGAFMLGVQCGRYIDFCHEEQPLKNSEYYIMPCVEGASAMPKCQADLLDERVRNGAKLLITYDGGVIRDFERWTGLRICGNEGVSNNAELELNGTRLSIARRRRLHIENDSARIIATDRDGCVAIAENKYGKGTVIFVNAPLESFYTKSYYPEKTNLYKVYELFFEGKGEAISVKDKFVFKTVHALPDGRVGVMLYNFNEDKREFEFTLGEGYTVERALFAECKESTLEMKEKYCYLVLK